MISRGVPSDDPGWRPALRGIGWIVIPGAGFVLRRRWRRRSSQGLVTLRKVFLSFMVTLGHTALVVLALHLTGNLNRGRISGFFVAGGVTVVGAYCLFAPTFLERRIGLACTDDQTLAKTYVSRFFLRVAFSDTAALIGLVGFILTNDPTMYLIGLAFSCVGFNRLAPTARHLGEDQERLSDQGCERSLVLALANMPLPRRVGDRRPDKRG